MAKIKIGVFGAARGKTMITQLFNDPDAVLVAVCDKYEPSLQSVKEDAEKVGLKIQLFTDFDEFIQCDMDAVVLANYANEHAPFAIRCLESGRHVMSEVLAVASLAEAAQLADAVEKSGKIYTFAENYCYFTTTQEMRRLYQMGHLGELYHAEGEYIHDCSRIWPLITYGQRNHWRNRYYMSFYCSHSLGPILFATGLRPVKCTGFFSPNAPVLSSMGYPSATHAIIIAELENGALVKSINGYLRRSHESVNYQMYCENGSMETNRWDLDDLYYYYEKNDNCHGKLEHYKPINEKFDEVSKGRGHGGSDYYTLHYFIRTILGDEEAKKETVDVYTAIDMCTPGILAYRSVLNGNESQIVPDFRDKAVRAQYADDHFGMEMNCTDPKYSAYVDNSFIPDSVYEHQKELWLAGQHYSEWEQYRIDKK